MSRPWQKMDEKQVSPWRCWLSAGTSFLSLFSNSRGRRHPQELATIYSGTNNNLDISAIRNNVSQLQKAKTFTSRILLDNPSLSSQSTWNNQNSESTKTSLIYPAIRDMCSVELRDYDDSRAQDVDLASAVSSLARRYLISKTTNHRVNTSLMIGGLLEAVHVLQDHIDTLGTRFSITGETCSQITSEHLHYKTLYRICCHQNLHCHDQVMYEDEPYYDGNMMWGNDMVLRGDRPVFNVETYLHQQPDLHFVIVKEYNCTCSHNVGFQDFSQPGTGSRVSSGRERLWVISPVLQVALKDISRSILPTVDKSIICLAELDAPYNILFHHHSELLALARRDPLRGPILDGLLSFIGTHYQSDYEDARLMFKEGRVCDTHLGKLFWPGQMVVSNDIHTGVSRASMVLECSVMANGNIKLKGWCWTLRGSRLVRAVWIGKITVAAQVPTPITQLAVYPAKYAPQDTMQKIAERGKKFWEIRNRAHLAYTGWDAERRHEYSRSRFMIDNNVYNDLHPGTDIQPIPDCDAMGPFQLQRWPSESNFGGSASLDCWPTFIDTSDSITAHEMYLVLPPTVKGYDMEKKRWVQLNVQNLHNISWNTTAFDHIILASETKDLMKALMEKFKAKRQIAEDKDDTNIEKGSGLVMLLHGAPGTGKTLTAESLAEYIQKPLYRITCGDIGTDPESVEKYLESVFYVARRWDSIVLMDEADVFLESRSLGDLQRNSMVSVFLRILEYHSGAVILTSNRTGTLDEAFMSRIHLAIHYMELNRSQRFRLWKSFAQSLRPEITETDFVSLEQHLPELATAPLNGRQIRNVWTVARQFAQFKTTSLSYEIVQTALETSLQFDRYTKGLTSATTKGTSFAVAATEEYHGLVQKHHIRRKTS